MARVQVSDLIYLGGRRWKKGVYESFPDILVDELPSTAVVLGAGEAPKHDSEFRAAAYARAVQRDKIALEEMRLRRAAEAEVEAKLAKDFEKLRADYVKNPEGMADAKKAKEKAAVKEFVDKKKAKPSGSVDLKKPNEASPATKALSDE